ncbi:Hypothetical_protein [Hexamita inflata]|uniref:Hypothetical_protein n=1 Tax=Hexamita inflata TaxID=28002 RepID=A0AA86QL98_9EUKA|nr:Hypothetical protein HINF_LOCUS42864 [Hexamita inflata]
MTDSNTFIKIGGYKGGLLIKFIVNNNSVWVGFAKDLKAQENKQYLNVETFKLFIIQNRGVTVKISTKNYTTEHILVLQNILVLMKKELKTVILIIEDSDKDILHRFVDYNQNNQNYRTSILWCSIAVFMMHIGYIIQCQEINDNLKIAGVAYCQQSIFNFYMPLIGKEPEINNVSINLEPHSEYLKSQLNFDCQLSIKNDIHMLYTMCCGVRNKEFNAVAQILPIFEWDLKNVDDTQVGNEKRRHKYQKEYNQHKKDIQRLKTYGTIKSHKYTHCTILKDYLLTNPFCIPFHYSNLVLELKQELLPLVSLQVEQSHAFKILYVVLDFIIFQNQIQSKPGTNYILSDGSKCGKTTFDISLAIAHLFHPDLITVPVIVQNIPNTTLQPLAVCQNIYLKNNMNTNFICALQNIKNSSIEEQQFSVINLIKSNLKDFLVFPEKLNMAARKIHDCILQQNIVKTIILNQLKVSGQNDYYYHCLSIQNDNRLQLIKQNSLMIQLCQFILIYRDQNRCDTVTQLLKLLNLNCLSELFKATKYLLVDGKIDQILTMEPDKYLVIEDEVCNRNQTDLKANNYSIIFQLIKFSQNFQAKQIKTILVNQAISIVSEIKEQVPAQNSQINDMNEAETIDLIKKLPDTEQLFLLMFPLSLFIQDTSNIQLEKLNVREIQELLSIQGFEAVMLRDLSNQLFHIKNESEQHLLTQKVIKSLLLKQFKQDNGPKLKEYLDVCSTDSITTLFSGTFCSLLNFFKYSTYLATSTGSRSSLSTNSIVKQGNTKEIEEVYIHSSIGVLPQLHPSLLNAEYYYDGINSVEPDPFKIKITETWQSNILNMILCCNTNATGFIQTIFAQVSPQLIIQNNNGEFINISEQNTYMGILPQNDIINKIDCNRFRQIFIAKGMLFEQKRVLKIKQSNEKEYIKIDEPAKQIFIQPLTQQNLPQLASVVNIYINKFEQYLTESLDQNDVNDRTVHSIAKLIIDSEYLLGGCSKIQETLSLILFMLLIKHDINSVYISQLEQIILLVDSLVDPCGESQTLSGIRQLDVLIDQYSRKTLKNSVIKPEKVYLTVIQPQFVPDNKVKKEADILNTQQKDLVYQEKFEKLNIEASKVIADKIFRENDMYDMVCIAIPIDQQQLLQLVDKADNSKVDFIITINLRSNIKAEPRIDLAILGKKIVGQQDILYIKFEPGNHLKEELKKRVLEKECLIYSTTKFLEENQQKQENVSKCSNFVYSLDMLRFLGYQYDNPIIRAINLQNFEYKKSIQLQLIAKFKLTKFNYIYSSITQITKYFRQIETKDSEEIQKMFLNKKYKLFSITTGKQQNVSKELTGQFSVDKTMMCLTIDETQSKFKFNNFKFSKQINLYYNDTCQQYDICEQDQKTICLGLQLCKNEILNTYFRLSQVELLDLSQIIMYSQSIVYQSDSFKLQLQDDCIKFFEQDWNLIIKKQKIKIHLYLQDNADIKIVNQENKQTMSVFKALFTKMQQTKDKMIALTTENNLAFNDLEMKVEDKQIIFCLKLITSEWFYKQVNSGAYKIRTTELLEQQKSQTHNSEDVLELLKLHALEEQIQTIQNEIEKLKLTLQRK